MGQHSFTYGVKSDDNEMLQRRLVALGYLPRMTVTGFSTIDGIFGHDTAVALGKFLSATGPVTRVEQSTFDKLFPEIASTRSNPLNNLSAPDWATSLAKNTIVQYVVVFLGGIVAAKFGLDPVAFKTALPDIINLSIGIIGGIAALIAAINGAIAASKPKVVVNGTVVKLKDMPVADQHTVAAIAAKNAA